MKLNGTHVRFDTCTEIYSSSQSKEQNYSLKIVIYRIFLDLMLKQFFFTILFFFGCDNVDLVFVENVMRFGVYECVCLNF